MPDQSNLNNGPKCNESINPDENICQKCGTSVNQAFSELGNVKETIENLELRLERLEKLLETQKSTEIKTNKLQFKDESLICSNCNLSNISSNRAITLFFTECCLITKSLFVSSNSAS